MDKDNKDQLADGDCSNEQELMDRRGFFRSLKKWSMIVIGSAVLGGSLFSPGTEEEAEAAGWINRGGGGAVVGRGGGAAVVGRGGGAAWANRAGGGGVWANRGAVWANRGVAWVNRF